LHTIHRNGNHLFYYAALVGDEVTQAYNRLNDDYNFAGYPSTFWDGGYQVLVGGYPELSVYETRIEACGLRPVPEGLDLILALDMPSAYRPKTYVRVANGVPANTPPPAPDAPTGPDTASPGEDTDIQCWVIDSEIDDTYFQFDWGDGKGVSDWYGPYDAGDPCTATYAWQTEGEYQIIVRARDFWGYEGDWSDPMTILIEDPTCCLNRGDIDHDGDAADIEDLVYLVAYMFQQGPPPPCEEGEGYFSEANVDGDGDSADIEDLVYMVAYMFQQPAPDLVPCP